MYNYYRSLQDTKLIPFGGKYLQSPSIGIIGNKDPQAVDEGDLNANITKKILGMLLSAFYSPYKIL